MSENAVSTVCRALSDPAMQEKFRAVLPPDVPLERFTRVSLTAVQNNPDILDCDRQSLYNAFVAAASRGLLPDGREGVIASFSVKTENGWIKRAQFMPMVGGIIKEMAKAGIKAHAVSIYERDTVELWNDDSGQHFRHVPRPFGDRGARIGALAWAQDRDGRTYVETLNAEDIARIVARSKSRDRDGNVRGPWRDAPDRMEQKSALHRLRNRLGIDLSFARDEDEFEADAVDADTDVPSEAVPDVAPVRRRPRGLQAALDAVAVSAPQDGEPQSAA